jgi:hypothetical protein
MWLHLAEPAKKYKSKILSKFPFHELTANASQYNMSAKVMDTNLPNLTYCSFKARVYVLALTNCTSSESVLWQDTYQGKAFYQLSHKL